MDQRLIELLRAPPVQLQVVRVSYLEWDCWIWAASSAGPPAVIVGRESWYQVLWLTVEGHVLATDPGPLDARVP